MSPTHRTVSLQSFDQRPGSERISKFMTFCSLLISLYLMYLLALNKGGIVRVGNLVA